jgi:protease-4
MDWAGQLSSSARGHTALVEVNGLIGVGGESDADAVIEGLNAAFENPGTKGVIVRINSPGGSPVQSGQIYREIRRLREKFPKVPVYTVIADVCASGGYYVAAAADRIYADPASLVGSIGVLVDGFGFVGTMDKLGVERRLITAGRNKSMLDPFSPVDPAELRHMQGLLDQVHEQFIESVKAGRRDRLADDRSIFSGLIWTGERARELGLVDEFGDAGYVAREIIGVDRIVNFTPKKGWYERLVHDFGLVARNLTGLSPATPQPRLR